MATMECIQHYLVWVDGIKFLVEFAPLTKTLLYRRCFP